MSPLMQDVVFGPQEMLNDEPRNASEMVGYKYGLQVDRRHLLRLKPRSPTLQADSLSAEPQGKPKNTGVGSLALLQQILQTQKLNWGLLHCRRILYQLSYQVKLSESRSVMSDSFRPQGLYSPWNSLGQNTGVGTHSLLQRIFPIQGSNPGLPHCRHILYQLSHQGSPRILEWVAFSSRSSQPKNRTGVSCIAGGFLTN